MRKFISMALLASASAFSSAQLILPFMGTDAGATVSAFQIIKSGSSGRANTLYITNASNASDALLVNTVGLGRAGYFSINNPSNNQIGMRVDSNGTGTSMFGFMTGTGRAGFFRITNSSNASPALMAQTDGTGPGLKVLAGTGLAADFDGDVRINGASLNALQVFGGINASAGITAAGFNGSGANLTNLNASNVSTGTLPDSRLPSNVARTNVGNIFTQPQILPNGSQSSPAIGLGSALFGLFRSGSRIGFVANGTEVLTLTSGGSLGVGTTSPSRRVHIVGANGVIQGGLTLSTSDMMILENADKLGIHLVSANEENIWFGNGSTGYRMVRIGSNGDFGIFSGVSAPKIVIQGSTGNVGIKTNFASTALQVSGTITGTAKNFLIDHPEDPYNKTLRHACVESDEYKNVYDGTVTTDSRGYATVTMPDWFESLNQSFRYQLTVIDDGDDFVMAKVSRKLSGNRFTIRTSKPDVEVSWMVTGVRKDAYVRDNPLVVEQAKPAAVRGTLLYTGASQQRPKP